MKKLLPLFILSFALNTLSAQVFNGTGGPIPNNSLPGYFTITTSGLPAATSGAFGIEEICITINHTRAADLVIHVEAPDYTTVELARVLGGSGANYTNTCFTNSASAHITTGTAPFTGTFKPSGFFGRWHEGINPNGNWRLRIVDVYGGPDEGAVIGWSIKFSANVAQPVNFASSNLPIIRITAPQGIPDEPKAMADMAIIYNTSGGRNNVTDIPNNYNGKIMIERRGSSSQQFDKKPYSFKTVNEMGNELDVPLLGMPADNEWVLHAPYSDKSLLRNYTAYNLAEALGRYAPRARFVEVIINNVYEGVYVLTESINRGPSRVDIAKMTNIDNFGDAVTGGYIVKIDKLNGSNTAGWLSSIASTSPSHKVFYQYHYPEADRITTQQMDYIQNYMREFEEALMSPNFRDPVTGYKRFIDLQSFADMFLITELAKNPDGYRISTYMYKDKDSKGGKLTLGPVWDFDIAWSNAYFAGATDPAGWQYQAFDTQFPMPIWWSRMMTDTAFTNMVKCRWWQLRNFATAPDVMGRYIDQFASMLSEAQGRNFTMWPIIGVNVWPNPGAGASTWQGEVDVVKSWITSRVAWMDANMPGDCSQTPLDVPQLAAETDDVQVFPNPATAQASLYFNLAETGKVNIALYDITGREIKTLVNEQKQKGAHQLQVDLGGLRSGVYFYRLNSATGIKTCKIIVQ